MSDPIDQAVRIAQVLLEPVQQPTYDDLAHAATTAANVPGMEGVPEDVIVRRLEELVSVFVGEASVLFDTSYVPWLASQRADIDWRFWDRYRQMLQKTWDERVITNSIDAPTDRILDLLGDPATPGLDRRGLVVGHVQSGKTANYVGLIAKAIDAGYRIIVVLAGSHNDLRSQTQYRLDEGVIGWDTHAQRVGQTRMRIGVGDPGPLLDVTPLTSSAPNGDFTKAQSTVLRLPNPDQPYILVVKKNKSVLERVNHWIGQLEGKEALPFLLVDDEADYYSLNTKAEDDPATINRLVRAALKGFPRSSYVGYTATPFASIFIDQLDPDIEGDYGEDLFPRSFVFALSTPTNYLGPNRLFGIETTDDGPTLGERLPLVRPVSDNEDWLPSRHKNHHPLGHQMPESLTEAINAFILSTAARRARGSITAHKSMLIHVTRFTSVQDQVHEQVTARVHDIRNQLRFQGPGNSPVLIELRDLWENHFRPTSETMGGGAEPWETIRGELQRAVEAIEVMKVNGNSADALRYVENRQHGLSVIAVGGDKLSRGLTLEGLSTSYYLRTSRAYDTLLQMGRWYGYRPGYEDLTRLYASPQLVSYQRDTALANTELYADFERMELEGATPQDFGLKVRTHPDLMVSAPGKVRGARRLHISFSGLGPQPTVFSADTDDINGNLAALARLLRGLSSVEPRAYGFLGWTDADAVVDFFSHYTSPPSSVRVRADLLAEYTKSANRDGELSRWAVLVTSPANGLESDTISLEGHPIRRTQRAGELTGGVYSVQNIYSESHEAADLTEDQGTRALDETNRSRARYGKEPTNRAGGPQIRAVRPAEQGLLILYLLDSAPDDPSEIPEYVAFKASFPHSRQSSRSVEYQVNETFLDQYGLGDG